MSTQTSAVLSALQSGSHATSSISAATGLPIKTVQNRVWELVRLGVVRAYSMRSDGRTGRMPKLYRLKGGSVVQLNEVPR